MIDMSTIYISQLRYAGLNGFTLLVVYVKLSTQDAMKLIAARLTRKFITYFHENESTELRYTPAFL